MACPIGISSLHNLEELRYATLDSQWHRYARRVFHQLFFAFLLHLLFVSLFSFGFAMMDRDTSVRGLGGVWRVAFGGGSDGDDGAGWDDGMYALLALLCWPLSTLGTLCYLAIEIHQVPSFSVRCRFVPSQRRSRCTKVCSDRLLFGGAVASASNRPPAALFVCG